MTDDEAREQQQLKDKPVWPPERHTRLYHTDLQTTSESLFWLTGPQVEGLPSMTAST